MKLSISMVFPLFCKCFVTHNTGVLTRVHQIYPMKVAAMLVEMFAQCGRLDYTLANAVRAEEQRLLAKKVATPGSGMKPSSSAVASSMAGKRPGAEDDESSSSDEDDDMGEVAAAGGGGAAAAGSVDDDGWATVSGKKAGKGGRR